MYARRNDAGQADRSCAKHRYRKAVVEDVVHGVSQFIKFAAVVEDLISISSNYEQ
jgi:hypothetical protein